MNYKISFTENGVVYDTLLGIFPPMGVSLKIFFVGKTPIKKSVEKGHYFQGRQGTAFWNKLKKYDILKVKQGTYEDENLVDQKYGITDIVKKQHEPRDEPKPEEYIEGLTYITNKIKIYNPEVIVFVYMNVLTNILLHQFEISEKVNYGFNPQYDYLFDSRVFVFPMPGTRCTRANANVSLLELKKTII